MVLDGHFTKAPAGDPALFLKRAGKGWSQMLEKLADFVGRQTVEGRQ